MPFLPVTRSSPGTRPLHTGLRTERQPTLLVIHLSGNHSWNSRILVPIRRYADLITHRHIPYQV